MAEAVLQFTVRGGEELAAVLGRAQAAATRSSRATVTESERAEKAKTRAALREIAARERADKAAAKAYEKAQRQASMVAAAEAAKREKASEREAKAAARNAEAMAAAYVRAERVATRAVESESQRRRRAWAQGARDLARGTLSAGTQFASVMHGQIQGAREQRADTERTLNQALYQAGAGGSNAGALRAQVMQFAQREGMDSGALAGALNRAQTEFSVLGNSRSTQEERSVNLRTQLAHAAFARDTGQDPGEVMRVAGMLQNAGITGTDQRSALLGLTGMAQRGAIELSAVTSTAMAPMLRRIAQEQANVRRANPQAGQEELAAAARRATMQSFAEMEVGRSLGISPREMGNVTAQLGTALQSDAVQQRMLNNLRHGGAQGRAAEGVLFERGRLRSQYQSALGLAGGLQQAFGGDAAAMQNVFAGSGAGNAQGLQGNWRRILGSMMQGGPEIQRMLAGAGRDFTEADVARGRELFGGDAKSVLTKDRETQSSALTDNTNALVGLSNTIASWAAQNPFASAAATTFGGSALGGIMNRIIGGGGGGGAAAGGGGAAAAGGSVAAAGLGTSIVAGGLALGGGLVIGDLINSAIEKATGSQQHESIFSGGTWSELWADITGGQVTRRDEGNQPNSRQLSAEDITRAVERGSERGARQGTSQATITINPTQAAQHGMEQSTGTAPRGGANP